jgi:hypothetical protein
MGRRVTVEDGFAVIRVPLSEVHSLQVALADCPCKSTKSNKTAGIRARLAKALATVTATMGVRA